MHNLVMGDKRIVRSKQIPVVSIITPVFNAAQFLRDTIRTVQDQTYVDWELIFIDDGSTDDSVQIIEQAAEHDPRIRLLKNKSNRGAGYTRNQGIKAAQGRYIAFIDADDLWHKDKLKKQVAFSEVNGHAFTFTAYEFADADGEPTGKKVFAPPQVTYKSMLKNSIAWTSTIIIDTSIVSKEHIVMPDIPRGQDLACWLRVLQKTGAGYGLDEVLANYRRTRGSLSSGKLKAIRRTWYIYYNIERINAAKSMYYVFVAKWNAFKKRV